MRRFAASRAFSLIEVIIAVALFATSIVTILALLPALSSRGMETTDRLVAQQLPAALQVELRRLAADGFDSLAALAPVMGRPPQIGLMFVATRNGARLHPLDHPASATGRIAEADQYYLVECWRFADGPLQFKSAQSALAVVVRVSWPYRQPGSTVPAAPESRHECMFTVGINR